MWQLTILLLLGYFTSDAAEKHGVYVHWHEINCVYIEYFMYTFTLYKCVCMYDNELI